MTAYQLAEINIARMKGVNILDPIMQEFVDNLDHINALAESSEGFIWRLKDDSNNATQLNPYNDEQVIVNISVWKDVESLSEFVYRTMHTDFLKRRSEWFQKFGQAYFAMWWIESNDYPTIEDAKNRLDHLQNHGPSLYAFNFREKYEAPENK